MRTQHTAASPAGEVWRRTDQSTALGYTHWSWTSTFQNGYQLFVLWRTRRKWKEMSLNTCFPSALFRKLSGGDRRKLHLLVKTLKAVSYEGCRHENTLCMNKGNHQRCHQNIALSTSWNTIRQFKRFGVLACSLKVDKISLKQIYTPQKCIWQLNASQRNINTICL